MLALCTALAVPFAAARPVGAAPTAAAQSAVAGPMLPPASQRVVSGWVPFWATKKSLSSVLATAELWSDASPFWFTATGATTIRWQGRRPPDPGVVTALRERGIAVLPAVTESLKAKEMAALLADGGKRRAHVARLTQLVSTNGYDGIDLDYESMNYGADPDRERVRAGFVRLVAELSAALHARGKLLAVTVGPRRHAADMKWRVFDYAGIAPHVDLFRIMTYDYHWRGSKPGPVAPVRWVRRVIAYAVTVVPPAKIQLGVPLYGYDWPANPRAKDGYGRARSAPMYDRAQALRRLPKARHGWDAAAAAPFIVYEHQGVRHVVWYTDSRAVAERLRMVEEYGLRGVAFWYVGSEDVRMWPIIREVARKRGDRLGAEAGPADRAIIGLSRDDEARLGARPTVKPRPHAPSVQHEVERQVNDVRRLLEDLVRQTPLLPRGKPARR